MSLGAHGDGTATGLIALTNTVGAHDDGTCREIGSWHDLHELVDRRVWIVDEVAGRLNCLGKVVRSDIRRHANSNTLTAVDQQVGETRRQGNRLCQGFVVVGLPVDGVLLQIAQELHGGFRQTTLGVTHGSRGVAIDVAKVAMAVDERGAHREPLGKTDHRFVDRRVTVRVVLTDYFTDGPGRLLVRAVGIDTALVHRV